MLNRNVSSFILFLTAKKAADESKSDGQCVEENVNAASPDDNPPLPPFNPLNPVGKTGFVFMITSLVFSRKLLSFELLLLFFLFFFLFPQVWSSWPQRQDSFVRCATGSSVEPKRLRLYTAKPGNITITSRCARCTFVMMRPRFRACN